MLAILCLGWMSAAHAGSLVLTKTVTGAGLVAGQLFPVSLSCSLNGVSVAGITPAAAQSVAAGGNVTFGNIPAGAACYVFEDSNALPPAPVGYDWVSSSLSPPNPVVVGAAATAVELTNVLAPVTTLTVNKAVVGGTVDAGALFPILLSCQTPDGDLVDSITPTGSVRIPAGGSVTYRNVPVGADCSVDEGVPPPAPAGLAWAGYSRSQALPLRVGPGPNTETLTDWLVEAAKVMVVTEVYGGAPLAGLQATFTMRCQGYGLAPPVGISWTRTAAPGSTITFDNVPVIETCTVNQTQLSPAPAGYVWGTQSWRSADVFVYPGTNQLIWLGALLPATTVTVNAQVTGGAVPAGTTADFLLVCRVYDPPYYDETFALTIALGSSAVVTGIPVGATCGLTQSRVGAAPQGGAWGATSVAPALLTTTAGANAITWTNTLEPGASLAITKTLSGGSVPAGTTFQVSLACARSDIGNILGMIPSGAQYIGVGATATFAGIPAGAHCSVQEGPLPPAPDGFVWGSPTQPSVTLGASTNNATLDNHLLALVGVSVTPTATGAVLAPGALFKVALSCQYPAPGFSPQNVAPGAAATFAGIPQGTQCSVNVTPPAPPAGFAWDGIAYAPGQGFIVGTGPNPVSAVATLVPLASLSIAKVVSGGTAVPGSLFSFSANCVSGPAPIQVAAGDTFVAHVPPGSTCFISESTHAMPSPPAGFAWSSVEGDGTFLTVGPGGATATFTNRLVPVATVSVAVVVTGGTVPAETPFTVSIACNNVASYPASALPVTGITPGTSQPVAAGGTATFGNVPTQANCFTSVVLPAPPAGYAWLGTTVSPQNFRVAPGSNQVTFTATLTPLASLTITHAIVGGTASAGSMFQAGLSCSIGFNGVSGIQPPNTQLVGVVGSVTYTNIPVGASCYAQFGSYPPAPAGYRWELPAYVPDGIVIGAGTNRIDVTSTLTQLVTLTVNVGVTGGTASPGSAFGINVLCQNPGGDSVYGITPSLTQQASGGGSVTFGNIPIGSQCGVSQVSTPQPPAGYAWTARSVSPSPILLGAGPNLVSVTNQLTATATLGVTKALTGGTLAPGTAFTVVLACTLNGSAYTSTIAPASQQPVVVGGTVQFSGVPVGAACTISEQNLPAAPAGFTWLPAVVTPGPILIASGSNAVTLTNRLAPLVTLTVAGLGNGGGTIVSTNGAFISCGARCAATVGTGTQIVLAATPAAGAYFAGWDGACTGLGPCVLGMEGNRNVIATFSVNPVTLAVRRQGSGSGTVQSEPAGITCGATCDHTYPGGVSVALTATPAPGSTFAGWLGGCGGATLCNVPMVADATVQALFSSLPRSANMLDIDGDGNRDALSDGLLIVRHLFGLSGAALTNGVLGVNATRDAPAIALYLSDNLSAFDVDGDGRADALTDGLLILRYLFGLRGTALVQGALSPDATRDATQIEQYLQDLMH